MGRNGRRFPQLKFFALAATLLCSLCAISETASAAVEVRAGLTDGTNKVISLNAKLEWKWKSFAEVQPQEFKASIAGAPKLVPVAEVTVDLPARITHIATSDRFVRILEPIQPSLQKPGSPKLRVELQAGQALIELELERAAGKRTLGLSLTKSDSPQILVAQNCADLNLGAEVVDSKTSPFVRMIGLSCSLRPTKPAGLEVTLHHFPTTSVKRSSVGTHLANHALWTTRLVTEPAGGFKSLGQLGTFSLDAAQKLDSPKEDAGMVRVQSMMGTERRLNFFLGTGLTYLSYVEQPSIASIRELLLTVKGGVDFMLIPRRLSVNAGGFANMLTLTKSNATTPSARFFGGTFRLAYRLPFNFTSVEMDIGLGSYIWGMMVDNNAYGIRMLTGYQVILPVRFKKDGVTKVSIYGRYAPISESIVPSFTNYELAFGGTYRLSPAHVKRFPILLTLDGSMLTINNIASARNTADLHTVSLGVGTSF